MPFHVVSSLVSSADTAILCCLRRSLGATANMSKIDLPLLNLHLIISAESLIDAFKETRTPCRKIDLYNTSHNISRTGS